MEFKIREGLYLEFLGKIDKLNKKADKLNVERIVVEVVDEVVEENIIYKVIQVSQIDDIKINGWTFMAKLERNVGDSFVLKGNSENIPQSVKDVRTCQHCNTNRRRNLYYILKNEETCEYIVVGKTCLIDFIGHNDAEKIANLYSLIGDCLLEYKEKYSAEYDAELDSDRRFYNDFAFDIKDIIRASIVSINDRGYHKSESDYSTKDEVLNILWNVPGVRDLVEKYEVMNDDEVNKMIECVMGMDNKTDFINNLQIIIKDKYVKPNLLGYVVCIPTVYQREQDKLRDIDRKRQNLPVGSDYVGNIKDKVTLSLVYEKTISFDGYYGRTYMEFFRDKDDNVIIWKTSTCKDFEENVLYEVACTIKEHSEYNGIKQTYINRPKFKQVKVA